ncbi:MAG: diguanylate cyclase domain-containing protein [Cellulosilyticaceae bacterium]
MKGILVLKDVLNYIETHMEEDLTLEELATLHYISLSHLHRLFSAICMYSLKEYIQKRRLTCAALELIDSEWTVLDIACKYGYESYEGFSRAFKKFYNASPNQFRKKKQRIELFPRLEIQSIKYDKEEIYMISIVNINEEVLEKGLQGMKDQYLICADIDQFVSYNEKYGYDGGDLVLAEAAKRIENALTQGMKSYRIGADEFIIITETANKEEVELVAKRIVQAAELPVIIKGETVYFNMSLGIVKAHHNMTDESNLVKQAQDAMLLAKEAGRNCYKLIG